MDLFVCECGAEYVADEEATECFHSREEEDELRDNS